MSKDKHMIGFEKEEKLNEAKDFHSVLYNNGNDYWDFKFADLYSSGVGIFTDHLNQELILTPEEIKAVYINYFEE